MIVYGLNAFIPTVKGVIRDLRPTWTLEEIGAPYQRRILNAGEGEHKGPEYRKVNPFGKVPAIDDDGFVLFESAAVCNYIGDKYAKLIPKPATKERALHDQWVSFAISTLEPQAFQVFAGDFFWEKHEKLQERRDAAYKLADGFLKVVDGHLADRPHLLGKDFGIADVMLGAVLRVVGHTDLTAKHPRVKEYSERLFDRPAFKRASELNGTF